MSAIAKVVLVICICSQPIPCKTTNEQDAIFSPEIHFDRDSLLSCYFNRGYNAYEIVGFLLLCHGISISVHHVRRLLARLGLRRRNNESDLREIINTISRCLLNGNNDLGYRTLWKKLNIIHGLRVTQRTTLEILRFLDAEGVNRRRARRLRRRQYVNKGPMFLIHIDGNDKLKPYGISIHGAIDGFSRKILWLKAGYTNKNPNHILRFYLELICGRMKMPRTVRFDDGTENVIRDVHMILRSIGNGTSDWRRCALSERSTANQRIEMFWGILNRACLYFWRDLLRGLRDSGDFLDNDPVQIECVRFCFLPIIQSNLDEFQMAWNSHRIRAQRSEEGYVTGIPDVLFFQPEIFGTFDCSLPLPFPEEEIREFADRYCPPFPAYGCCEEFIQLIEVAFDINRRRFVIPSNASDAIELYYIISSKLSHVELELNDI